MTLYLRARFLLLPPAVAADVSDDWDRLSDAPAAVPAAPTPAADIAVLDSCYMMKIRSMDIVMKLLHVMIVKYGGNIQPSASYILTCKLVCNSAPLSIPDVSASLRWKKSYYCHY
mmetsp:Transcript_25098/g.41817  ORF Transcript_25098/g.41817 Transcript_25098/m.41817 type:complete len:115 (-) Transcript_25098:1430-1774(-)